MGEVVSVRFFYEKRGVFVEWDKSGQACKVEFPDGPTHTIYKHSTQCRGSQYGGGVIGKEWYTFDDDRREFITFDAVICAAFGFTRVFQQNGSRYDGLVTVQVGCEFFECPKEGGRFGNRFEFRGGHYEILGNTRLYDSEDELKTTLTANGQP